MGGYIAHTETPVNIAPACIVPLSCSEPALVVREDCLNGPTAQPGVSVISGE